MKDIPGYEGRYAITRDGRVWSHPKGWIDKSGKRVRHHNGRWLKLRVGNVGYRLTVVDGRSRTVHRLLGMTYIPNPLGKPQINHKNGIKTDNRLSNLEWCTNKENAIHAIRTGLHSVWGTCRGEMINTAKLTEDKVREIRRLRALGEPVVALGKKFGIRHTTISQIANRRSWKHVL